MPPLSRRAAVGVAVGGLLALAVTALVWLAYRAVREWERGTVMLVDQRSEEALTLLTVALSRDMKGVHHSVLASFDDRSLNLERRYELEDLFARAFARFPYPESFFVWRATGPPPAAVTFTRVERPPAWLKNHLARAYPVVASDDATEMRGVLDRVREIAVSGRRFDAFETTIGAIPSQVVVHLLYRSGGDRALLGAVGFTVNLEWVAGHYFQEILSQISRIGQVEDSILLSVSDDRGRAVTSTRGASTGPALHERTFPLSFLDAELVGPSDASAFVPPIWTLSVGASDDPAIRAALRGSTRTLWLIVLCAAAAIAGIVFSVRAIRASADLAEMQSEFVASATHELKTPLALFQLVADTLAKGRYASEEAIRAYGTMLSEQTHLLERLIDNMLAFASLSHVAQRYHFEEQRLSALVEAALERFDARIAATGLEVIVDMSPDLPPIRADRTALLQAFDNVIDNAIKYSPEGRTLTIAATEKFDVVQIEVRDEGPGIPLDQRDKVFEKFYRGQHSSVAGSGLGLAIARRVLEDHRGSIGIRDNQPRGTVIVMTIPVGARG